jgi:hypothetical protein
MKKKIETVIPSADVLLRIAKRIEAEAKRAEDPVPWREGRLAECQELLLLAQQEKEDHDSWPLILEAAQRGRDAGIINSDVALSLFYTSTVHMDPPKDAVLDRIMGEIGEKIVALRKKKGLAENDTSWTWKNPETPEEYKTLAKKAMNHKIAAILRQYGEDEVAALLLNHRDAFNLRFKAGLLEFFKNRPEVRLDDEFFREVSA